LNRAWRLQRGSRPFQLERLLPGTRHHAGWGNRHHAAACPTCATLFGNSGAGILLGPGQFNFDNTLSKQFRIAEHANLQFRAEFFNLLNHPQFQGLAPSTGTGGATAFLPQPLTAGASIISSTSINPRVVQLGLKLLF
jgi:hypothetical protein